MVTSELLYAVFRSIVGAHVTDVSFHHDTNKLKDRSASVAFPACFWNLPTSGMYRPGESDVYFDTFTLSMLFLEQTASDRGADEMLAAHSRMELIAKQCFVRFHDLYLSDTTTFEGQAVDCELVGNPSFTPIYDEGTAMLTGVDLSFTVRSMQPVCVDSYFA